MTKIIDAMNNVQLEPVSKSRKSEFIRLAKLSRPFHKKWVVAPSTEAQFSEYLDRASLDANQCFFICRSSDQKLVGVVNLSQIVGGFFQSAYLGYYLFTPFTGKNYMSDGLAMVLDLAFTKLELHRLEANIQPVNKSSIKVVKRLRFRMEGFSPKYLQVDGKWRDHERWAIIKEDWLKSAR